MTNKIQTLEEFEDDMDYAEDGHYAVWHADMFYDSKHGGNLYGFTGDIVYFDKQNGFETFPEKLENIADHRINIILLAEMPCRDEF